MTNGDFAKAHRLLIENCDGYWQIKNHVITFIPPVNTGLEIHNSESSHSPESSEDVP